MLANGVRCAEVLCEGKVRDESGRWNPGARRVPGPRSFYVDDFRCEAENQSRIAGEVGRREEKFGRLRGRAAAKGNWPGVLLTFAFNSPTVATLAV